MAIENGEWIMRGLDWNNPYRIRTWRELISWINEVGFLPLFANDVEGFSAEEHVSPDFWWTNDPERDPWLWREYIARSHEVAYGKFFDKKAGFISVEWLPYFANYRRDGYDFDARWQDGLANIREKTIMNFYISEDTDGETVWKTEEIVSTDLKKRAGFGKEGAKNYPGIVTGLQMNLYLVITDFRRRRNKKGREYGMPVSVMFPPETIWGYDAVTAAYRESPHTSWERLIGRVRELYPSASVESIRQLIGKEPE